LFFEGHGELEREKRGLWTKKGKKGGSEKPWTKRLRVNLPPHHSPITLTVIFQAHAFLKYLIQNFSFRRRAKGLTPKLGKGGG